MFQSLIARIPTQHVFVTRENVFFLREMLENAIPFEWYTIIFAFPGRSLALFVFALSLT